MVSFTSHGAMVDVSLPGGGVLHCYIPLTAMGTPPPTKARQVLKKGEVRPFVLAGLDPPRRVAELALLRRRRRHGEEARRSRPRRPHDARKATAKKATSTAKAGPKKAGPGQEGAAKKAAKAKKAQSPAKKAPGQAGPAKKTAGQEGSQGQEGARPRRPPRRRRS